ncbi:hypothetical protein BN2156_02605 [Mycolicibacterium neworleansense]|uniref:Uncharacterized protein n=1 Tax=Mycolicibacterium neworleansense TaxID=146018 RepID=A0A0H5RQI7_9MYCO|nr:hypothetical protein BN2156_02605 [Mycolicibacterium neworleansense]
MAYVKAAERHEQIVTAEGLCACSSADPRPANSTPSAVPTGRELCWNR